MAVFVCKKKCFYIDRLYVPGEEMVADKAPDHFYKKAEKVEIKKEAKKEESIEDFLAIPKKKKA